MIRRLVVAGMLFVCAAEVSRAEDDPVAKAVAAMYEGIREESLPNGLRVYLKPVPGAPTVTVMTAYRVGSADENLDQTGLSHYLEHLMFKGTARLMPGDIDRQTRRAGGRNNAYTTNDFTNYHFDFAADRWEAALQIEAERMRGLRIDTQHEFQQEKGAVIAELDGNEDEPYELENKAILPLLFGPKSPYGHPIIGEKSHVRSATAEIIKAYYDRWYHPNNACLVIVGGFNPDQAWKRIKELFGPIPSGKLPERKSTLPVERTKAVHLEIPSKFEAERFVMGFNTCRVGDPDDYVLDVIESILSSGKTGRLYRTLVLEKELAAEVVCANQAGRLPGWFSIELEVLKGCDRKEAEKNLIAELTRLIREPVSEAELNRVLRNVVSGLIFKREDVHELADGLVNAIATVDLNYMRTYLSRIQSVTAADVQRVAKKYFDPDKRVVVSSVVKQEKNAALRPGTAFRRKGPAYSAARNPTPLAAIGQPIDLTASKRVVLDNGLTLLLLENRRLPIVYAQAHVARVRLFEPADKAGVSSLVGMLLEEGTEKRSEKEIAQIIEDVGGVLVMAGNGGSVKVLSPDRSRGLGLMLECLAKPVFAVDSVRRLKEHLLSEIDDAQKQPSTRSQDEFVKLLYGNHPLGRSTFGTIGTVERLSAADCRRFHQTTFVPNNTVLVIVGDFDAQSVVEEVKNMTRDWQRRELPKLDLPTLQDAAKPVEKIISMPGTAQLNVLIGHLGITRKDPDYYKLLVMDNILGVGGAGFTDRLSSKLRDRQGLAYTVSASITGSASDAPGVFSAFVGTYPNKLATVRTMVLEEINRIRDERPTDREVEEAKDYLLGTLPFRLATNEDLAGQLLSIERHGLGLDYLTAFRKAIVAVTAEDVQAVARKHLRPGQLVTVAAGPVSDKGEPLERDP